MVSNKYCSSIYFSTKISNIQLIFNINFMGEKLNTNLLLIEIHQNRQKCIYILIINNSLTAEKAHGILNLIFQDISRDIQNVLT